MANQLHGRLVGVELYFDDLQQGKQFYGNTLGLELLDEEEGHHARFDAGERFVCLERKGSESYPSRDKAVVFLEVPDLAEAVCSIGEERIVAIEPPGEGRRRRWAALHDPEGYNIVLVEAVAAPSAVKSGNFRPPNRYPGSRSSLKRMSEIREKPKCKEVDSEK